MICNPIRDPVWEQIWSDPVQISSKYRNKQIVIVQIEERSKLIVTITVFVLPLMGQLLVSSKVIWSYFEQKFEFFRQFS